MRASLFATCLGNEFFAEACVDTVRLLRHLGVEVDAPAAQTCCGQPAFNAGRRAEAATLAGRTLDVFRDSEFVVLPSGSCAGMLRSHYTHLVATDRTAEAESLAARTYELSQFLVHVLGVERLGVGLSGRTIAYHHGCHALRELGVRDEPVGLLRSSGAEVVTWESDDECCGFGGLFSAKLPEVSGAMADRKLDTLPAVDTLTSADGGCLMQLGGRASHRGMGPPVRHLASVLWEAVG